MVRSTQKATTPTAGSSLASACSVSLKTLAASRPVPQASTGLSGSSPGSRISLRRSRVALRESRQRHSDPVGDVDEERSLASRVVDAAQTAGCGPTRLGEQLQGVGHLVHRLDQMHTVRGGEGGESFVLTGQSR